jgi:Fe-S-cluster containining protein
MTSGEDGLVWVTNQLAVGPAPTSLAQLDKLKARGISAILNVCPELPELIELEREHGFEVFHLPTPDEEAPDMEELEQALAWLDEALYLRKKAYIHCRYGLGRTGAVLNAYILRRGFSHFQAAHMLRKLRSKPANFAQWRSIRQYGKINPRLSVRKPCLELQRRVDLSPFLADFQALLAGTEAETDKAAPGARCGIHHDRCCHGRVELSLIEAVHLASALDALPSEKRRAAIARAASRRNGGNGDCPLLDDGQCSLGADRPLDCRLADLPTEQAEKQRKALAPALQSISNQLYVAFSGSLATTPLAFALTDVVSGRYVQDFFHHLRNAGAF